MLWYTNKSTDNKTKRKKNNDIKEENNNIRKKFVLWFVFKYISKSSVLTILKFLFLIFLNIY